jgi:hypothetical protein
MKIKFNPLRAAYINFIKPWLAADNATEFKKGAATLTYNGTATVFEITHGLGATPTHIQITSKSGKAEASVKTVSSTKVILTFAVAPTTYTETVYWQVYK